MSVRVCVCERDSTTAQQTHTARTYIHTGCPLPANHWRILAESERVCTRQTLSTYTMVQLESPRTWEEVPRQHPKGQADTRAHSQEEGRRGRKRENVCAYACVCMFVYVHVHVCVCVCACVHAHVCVCVHVRVRVHVQELGFARAHV